MKKPPFFGYGFDLCFVEKSLVHLYLFYSDYQKFNVVFQSQDSTVVHNIFKMAKQQIETVRDRIFFSYANLAMAHSAVARKQEKYGQFNFMVRARLFKGLKDGSMNMRTIFDDEKIKVQTGQICNYCGSTDRLALASKTWRTGQC